MIERTLLGLEKVDESKVTTTTRNSKRAEDWMQYQQMRKLVTWELKKAKHNILKVCQGSQLKRCGIRWAEY